MAATAYASLVSLLNTMDHVQIHPLLSTCFDKFTDQSLREKVDYLLDFVETHPDPDSEEVEDLFSQIADVVRMAEDTIEVEAEDRVRDGTEQTSPSFFADLHKKIEEMEIIKRRIMKLKEETGFITRQPTSSKLAPSSSDLPATSYKTATMVGFEGYLEQILDQLTGYPTCRRIIPIVGMGGIGKTTLAKNAYENLLTLSHFDVRAWVTVTQEFTASNVLFQAISCLEKFNTSETNGNDVQLGEKLSKTLYGRRYLIVLDDVWSVDAWEKIMFYFPENNNGSRIIITTRQLEVVDYFGSSRLSVDFLDDKTSWKLFCEKIFGQQGCPPDLEEVGKKIVKRCKGLPLTIIVVAGFLGKSSRTREYWEKISKDMSLILDLEDVPLSILHLSYKHLPICLRPCFLYLGLFPEDYQICMSKLIKQWIAVGFINPNIDHLLEETAVSYLKDLIGRNLIFVSCVDPSKKSQRCTMHDLVRDLCIKIAKKENFFCVERDGFVVDNTTRQFYPLTSLVRRLTGQGAAPSRSRLFRVHYQKLTEDDYSEFPSRQFNLRFIEQFLCRFNFHNYQLPSSISLLWSLQTLIFVSLEVVAPSEIWMMPQLRHVSGAASISVPDPPSSGDILVLRNLQTLQSVKNLNFTEEVCKRIPNIRHLGIAYDFSGKGEVASFSNSLLNVGCLDKLESLHFACYKKKYAGHLMKDIKLPSSLKELVLFGSNLARSDMKIISLLPHLQILELQAKAVRGDEWICVEEEFVCLKHLKIKGCTDLTRWIADSSSFPVLETLSLEYLSKLKEIPSKYWRDSHTRVNLYASVQ